MNIMMDELHRRVGCFDNDPTFDIYREGQVSQAVEALILGVEQCIEEGRRRDQAEITFCLEDVLAAVSSRGDQAKVLKYQRVNFFLGGNCVNRPAPRHHYRGVSSVMGVAQQSPLYAFVCNSALNTRSARGFAKRLGGPMLQRPRNLETIFQAWCEDAGAKNAGADANEDDRDFTEMFQALPEGDAASDPVDLAKLRTPATKQDFRDLALLENAHFVRSPLFGPVRVNKPTSDLAQSALDTQKFRSRTAFQEYTHEMRAVHAEKSPSKDFRTVRSECAASWKVLPDAQRQVYVARAEEGSVRFEIEQRRRKDLITAMLEKREMSRRAIRLRQQRPPRPETAFMNFKTQFDAAQAEAAHAEKIQTSLLSSSDLLSSSGSATATAPEAL